MTVIVGRAAFGRATSPPVGLAVTVSFETVKKSIFRSGVFEKSIPSHGDAETGSFVALLEILRVSESRFGPSPDGKTQIVSSGWVRSNLRRLSSGVEEAA